MDFARRLVPLPYVVSNYVQHAGWVYVTSDSDTTPWDTPPSYWHLDLAHAAPGSATILPGRAIAAHSILSTRPL